MKQIAKSALHLLLTALIVAGSGCTSTDNRKGTQVAGGGMSGQRSGMQGPGGQGGGMGGFGPPPDGAGGPPPEGAGGPPPDGKGGPGGLGGGQAQDRAPSTYRGAYALAGGKERIAGKSITTDKKDTSGVVVSAGGNLTLEGVAISTSGSTGNMDASNFYGQNAGVLAVEKSTIAISGGSIATSGEGANAVFASGEGSVITLSGTAIATTANSARGLDATRNGRVKGSDLTISTKGAHCAALATDRGEGTIDVIRVTGETAGEGSPGIYSTGTIIARDSRLRATGSEAAVIEGKNSITLSNTSISGALKHGVMLYQSFSGDAGVGTSSFTMDGGSLTAAEGPLFYVTNTSSLVNLKGVTLQGTSGILLKAGADRWGRTGENGGSITFTMKGQTAEGDVIADSLSSVSLILIGGSHLTGAINGAGTAASAILSLDSTSSWIVTADSRLTILDLPEGDIESALSLIQSQGHTVFYRKDANPRLKGESRELPGGGKLVPRE